MANAKSFETEEWRYREFKIENLFTSQNGDFDIKKEHINNQGIDVVTAGDTDYGILGKSDIKAKVFSGNTITVDMFGSVKYRSDEYKMVTHARVFSLKCFYDGFNEEIGLFITTCLQKRLCAFEYSNMCSWKKIRNLSISLPILTGLETNQPIIDETCQYHKDGFIPDWKYMQERIKELEQERIKELEQYLIVTGLNDYELTEEDKEILATKLFDGEQLESSTSGNGYLKEVRMFQLDELGAIEKVKGRPLKEYSSGTIPFVTGSQNDNGVVGYIDAPIEAISKGNCIVIDPIKGMCMYHPDDFVGRGFSGASVNALYIDKLNDVNALYICSAIEKYSKQIASYTNLFNSRRLATAKVALPIQTDSSNHPVIDSTHKYHPEGFVPDWEYMENYIRAMEKVVIRDVVVWKDEMIEKTKMVVNSTTV